MEPTILGDLTETELRDLVVLVNTKVRLFHDLGVVFFRLLSGKASFESNPTLLERCRTLEGLLEAENLIKAAVVARLQITDGVQWAIDTEGRVLESP